MYKMSTKAGLAISAAITMLTGTLVLADPAGTAGTSGVVAAGCRTNESTVSGVYVNFHICWNETGTRGDYYLKDTKKDGRRAEVWLHHPGGPANGIELDEVTAGVGHDTSGVISTLSNHDIWLRACSSNANKDPKCDSWS
jgi:hypothetical protein